MFIVSYFPVRNYLFYSDIVAFFHQVVSAIDVFCMFMSPGLMKIKRAKDIEVRLNEVERLLKNAINMPLKVRTTNN